MNLNDNPANEVLKPAEFNKNNISVNPLVGKEEIHQLISPSSQKGQCEFFKNKKMERKALYKEAKCGYAKDLKLNQNLPPSEQARLLATHAIFNPELYGNQDLKCILQESESDKYQTPQEANENGSIFLLFTLEKDHLSQLIGRAITREGSEQKPDIASLHIRHLELDDFLAMKKALVKDILHFGKCDPNDTRFTIVEQIIEIFFHKLQSELEEQKSPEFNQKFIENLIVFLANFINYFTGLKCMIYLDPFNSLTLEIFGNETVYFVLAEKFHYSLNLKILADIKIYDFQKGREENNSNVQPISIHEKNITQIEDICTEDISYFPPHLSFTRKKMDYFRRYDKSDHYHSCEINSVEKQKGRAQEESALIPFKSTCRCEENECSIFRSIDRLRLIQTALEFYVNMNDIKNLPEFSRYILLRSSESYKKNFQSEDGFLSNYIAPYESRSVSKLNSAMRNFLGEKVGFYFLFLSHYMKWLFVPTFFGLFYYSSKLWSKFDSKESYKSFNYYWDMVYITFIVVWATLYLKSWCYNQQFYKYIWGTEENAIDDNLNPKAEISRAAVFLQVQMPLTNKYVHLLKMAITLILSILICFFTVVVNLLLFRLSNLEVFKTIGFTGHKKKENISTRSPLLYHLLPVCCVILRQIITGIDYFCAKKLVDFENHIRISHYEDSFLIKITIFEFVNYYFNLFYIAYFKRFYQKCEDNNCLDELGHQLIIIIIISNLLNIFEIGIPLLTNILGYKVKQQLAGEHLIKKDIKESRRHLYTKDDYYDCMSFEYIEIILNYGYAVMFGFASPICFLFTLFHVWVERFVDSYKLIKLQNVPIISKGEGIGIVTKILKIFTFIGIITNSSIVLFDSSFLHKYPYRWQALFVFENCLLILFFVIRYDSLPTWFSYLDKIKFNYIVKVLKEDYNPNKQWTAVEQLDEAGDNES